LKEEKKEKEITQRHRVRGDSQKGETKKRKGLAGG